MGKLQLKIDGNDFTGVLADNPVIKDQLNACCRTLTFKLSLYGNRLDLLAHKVELFYKGKRWFIGEIKKQKEEHDGTNSITAYDPLFLFGKHEDDYYFKNQTATQIIKSMAKKIGLKVYKLENTNVVISHVLYKKGAPDKITVDVLARTWNSGGDKFWFRYDPVNNGILLKRRTVPEMIWAFKTGGNLISASRERSIEEMTLNVASSAVGIGTTRLTLAFTKMWSENLRSMGIDHKRFHDLRHTVATVMLEDGEAMNTVQEQLGHYDAGFTASRYGHVTAKMRNSAAVKLGERLEKVRNPEAEDAEDANSVKKEDTVIPFQEGRKLKSAACKIK